MNSRLCNGLLLFTSLSLQLLCSSEQLIDSVASTLHPPIELEDIGYQGTWERFCDPKLIKRDFPLYHTHELKSLRELLCAMKANNKIGKDRESHITLAAYKYCEMMRSSADDFLVQLIDRFSKNDTKKKDELLAPGPVIDSTACYKKARSVFPKVCVDEENPYFRMFIPLLARACTLRWLTTDDILTHLDQVCAGKRLTGIIDWDSIFFSIPFRGDRGYD